MINDFGKGFAYRNGNWYLNGVRAYPNAKQLKALQATLEAEVVQSPSQEGENATESLTEPSKPIPAKRTYTKKVKTE